MKEPATIPVLVLPLGIQGDEHVFRTHGGFDRAILSYSLDNYQYWRETLQLDLPEFAAFGENLTTVGLSEFDVSIGDVYSIDKVLLQVTQPRLPCHKIAARYDRSRLAAIMTKSNRTGILYRVIEPGSIVVGGRMDLVSREDHGISVAAANEILTNRRDLDGARRLLEVGSLAESRKCELRTRLDQ